MYMKIIKRTLIFALLAVSAFLVLSCDVINPFSASGMVPGGNWIYFGEGNTIHRMRLDGSEVEKNLFTVTPQSGEYTNAVQLNPVTEKIYIHMYFPAVSNRIIEANLDGSEQHVIVDEGTNDIYSMKIDTGINKLYYATSSSIVEVDLASTPVSKRNIYNGAFGSPFSLTTDYKGNIYYTYGAFIYKVDIGSQSGGQFPVDPAPAAPEGITFDKLSGNIFVYDGNAIVKISGSIYNSIFSSAIITCQGNMEFSTSTGKLFFYNDFAAAYELYSINSDGTGLKKIYSGASVIGGFDILSK